MILKETIRNTEQKENPLVSIIILTYNSEEFILETLESAKNQTYKNIELIISDDCSSDNTIDICNKWLVENQKYFINAFIVTTITNKGIPANCNRGIKASKGQWIKLLAGDDLFLDNCIEDNINWTQKNDDIHLLFSRVTYLKNENLTIKYGQDLPVIDERFYNTIAKEQYNMLVKGGIYVPAPTGFLKKETLYKLGLFDEEIRLCEDYPMWIKASKHNFRLDFMDKETVWYRIHQQSVMSTRNFIYEQSMKKVFFKYRFKYLLKKAPILAIDLFFRNISRTHAFWGKIVPKLLPLSYISFSNKDKK
ncbi:glycosyltransferase [Flavivirga aquimarina]|uniref:Glycosyltransferase n=1 Tax=Flavivirga aquimarina TaxID=2027862 RepID=A0ABT8WD92_9FLAO|nr:glycosyltransferase [Flavivirga aquimarina]MDO5971125.1 glycosyltransferase [Flavivirga aquimarina]